MLEICTKDESKHVRRAVSDEFLLPPAHPKETEPEVERTASDVTARDSKRRIWKDKSGTYEVEADFVSMAIGQVKLRKLDGKEIVVPINDLSAEDQDWIRQRGRR